MAQVSGTYCRTRLEIVKRKGRADAPSLVDPAVLDALREGHREFLRFVTGRTATLADAEDVLQEFYLKVIQNLRTIRNPGTLRAWLSQVLRRTLTDHYRRAAVRNKARERLREVGDAPVRINDDAELAVCRCLYRILPTLQTDQAEVIWRVDLLGQARNQVAKNFGISPNNLGVRIHRARRALQAALERYCITCPTHGFLNCACEEARRTLLRQKRAGSIRKAHARTSTGASKLGKAEKLVRHMRGESHRRAPVARAHKK